MARRRKQPQPDWVFRYHVLAERYPDLQACLDAYEREQKGAPHAARQRLWRALWTSLGARSEWKYTWVLDHRERRILIRTKAQYPRGPWRVKAVGAVLDAHNVSRQKPANGGPSLYTRFLIALTLATKPGPGRPKKS